MTKIEMMLTDMDGSAVRYKNEPFNSGWDAIGDSLPSELRKKWYETRDYYYPRKELYSQWFDVQCQLLKGLNIHTVTGKIFPVPYAPGFLNFFTALNPKIITGIISSGVDIIANKIQQEAGLDIVICNKLHISGEKFTGTGEELIGLWSKVTALEKICQKTGIPPDRVGYVGDSENDIGVLKMVGMPYIINPHPELKELAPEIKDYREIKLD